MLSPQAEYLITILYSNADNTNKLVRLEETFTHTLALHLLIW